MTKPILLPQPQEIETKPGAFAVTSDWLILIDSPTPQELFFTAKRVQAAIVKTFGIFWDIVASKAVPVQQVGLTLRLTPELEMHAQGYRLDISGNGITIEAKTNAGVFYGASTFIQVVNQQVPESAILPRLSVSDYPDFDVRGVVLDISRDRVPTLETAMNLVDRLAGWKVNQFQLYVEHTFAYRQHPDVWAKASPFTGAEIMELDAYCRERFVELVPNQNSFGHLRHWLEKPKYAPLAETLDGWDAWGTHFEYPFSLNPTDPGSLELVKSMYDEYLPHFTSQQFNVGLDEPLDVGQGKSKEAVEKFGQGKVYLYFLHKIYKEVVARGKTMQFWGDIIIEHPDLIPELPKDAIALEWGYEANHPFAEHGKHFADAGLKFFVCPGTSSWNSIAGRTDNALGNLVNAAENGLKYGAAGYLNTDWGDNGHWQSLPVSYLGFGMGAAYSWALEANREADVAEVISLHAFDDPTGNLGKVAYNLGNVYQKPGLVPHNGSVLFHALQLPLSELKNQLEKLESFEVLNQTWKTIDRAVEPLNAARPTRSDSELLKREFRLAERMLRHAIMRLRFVADRPDIKAAALYVDMKAIIDEYKALWLERNRPGGLADSVALLEKVRKDYA